MDSGPAGDNTYVDGVSRGEVYTKAFRPSRFSGEEKVDANVESTNSDLAEKFVDIVEQSRGCYCNDSNASCVSVLAKDVPSSCNSRNGGLPVDVFRTVDAFNVNMAEEGDAASGYEEKQQNHVTRMDHVPTYAYGGRIDGAISVSFASEKVPPDIDELPNEGPALASSLSQISDSTVPGSFVTVTCGSNLANFGTGVNNNNENDSICAVPLSASEVEALDTSNRLDIALASSAMYDTISAEIIDFPLHEMGDSRSVTSLSDLVPDCQDLFSASTGGDHMLLTSSTDADFISLVAGQSVHSEQSNDTQSSTPIGQDNHSMYANSETDPDENREPLTYELQQGYRILREIMAESNKSINWPFMNIIDSSQEGCEGYYEQVKQPMWLKKMRDKFDDRDYKNITEFVADMRLMLENCYRYNGPDHSISKKGQRLETMMEQKLALLSRELREKTSICATSGKPVEETKITGTRRRKVIIPHDSTALLNQLRLEAQEREREARRQLIQERKQAQEAYQQELNNWEEKLFENGLLNQMRSMWELPQIGHFLFLCAVPLNIGEVTQWELERCFLLPRESSTMQRIMTALLSTPYQRTRLDRKPVMPYKVWEDKLRTRVRQWYKMLQDTNGDIHKAGEKLGLDEKFFQVLGLRSLLEKKHYHELSYYQRVWLAKGLCDWCLETQDSIREAIEAQPITEQRPYNLGTDAEGFNYLHFPQFCGADLRIYKQAPVYVPTKNKEPSECSKSPEKGISKRRRLTNRQRSSTVKNKEMASTRPRDSRLRQNPRKISQFQVAYSDDECETSTQKSSAIDTTDLDSGQESSTQDSGISEQSDNNEPPSKTSKSGNSLLENGTDVSLDLLIDATPSRLTRSLMRNLTKVFSSTSTPSASRENSPGHSRQRLRTRHGGMRTRKFPKSSRESSPSVQSDTHSMDGSPYGDHLNMSAKRNQQKRTRRTKRGVKTCGNQKTDNESEQAATVKDEFSQVESKNTSRTTSDEVNDDTKIKTETNTSIKCEIKSEISSYEVDDKCDFILEKGNSEEMISGSCSRRERSAVAESVNSANLNNEDISELTSPSDDTERRQKTVINLHGDSAQAKTVSNIGVENVDVGDDMTHIDVPSPKTAIGNTCVESQRFVGDNDINGVVNVSQEISLIGNSLCGDILPKCASANGEVSKLSTGDPSFKKDTVGVTCCGSGESSIVVSLGPTPDVSRSPTPMDLDKEDLGSITEMMMPKLSPVLPLPDGSLKKAVMEDEISLASTISAVDPNYRPDSPQYQNLGRAKSALDDGASASYGNQAASCESSPHDEKCSKQLPKLRVKDEPLDDGTDKKVDEHKPVITTPVISEVVKGIRSGNSASAECRIEGEKSKVKTEEIEEEHCEITLPEFGKFQLVVTDLETLRRLIAKLAELGEMDTSDSKKPKTNKLSSHKCCVAELRNRLQYLLQELEPWEQKLNSLRKKAIVKMKKEQDSYVEEPEKEEIEDVWESEESDSDSSENEESDSSSEEEEEGKTVGKPDDKETVGVTTRGGMKRKKKVMSSDLAKKKKLPETTKEHSISSSPNILQKKTQNSDQQPTNPPIKSTTSEHSKDLMFAIIGNQPVLLPSSQLASLNNTLFLAQPSTKSGASHAQPQIALLSSTNLGGNVLLTTRNPALLQQKTTHDVAKEKAVPVVSGSQSHAQQMILVRSPASGQSFIIAPPQTASSKTVTACESKSSGATDVTKPAVTCFNYSNISQLPPDVIQKLLKNQERRLHQSVLPSKTSVSAQSCNAAPVSSTTAFTKLLKAGLLPVAPIDVKSKPITEQPKIVPVTSKSESVMIMDRQIVSKLSGMGAITDAQKMPVQQTVCTPAPHVADSSSLVQKTSSTELNLLQTLNRSASDPVSVQDSANVQSPGVILEDKVAKDGTRFALLGTSPKPKYASNVTVKTLLENKHAQLKVLPTQAGNQNSEAAQTSVVTTAEELESFASSTCKTSDNSIPVTASSPRVLSGQPVRSVPLIKGYSQLPASQAVQGSSGQVQLVLPGKQQLVMPKPGKQVQLLPAAGGKIQLMQGSDGQLHLLQAGTGQNVQLIQGAGAVQGVHVVQGTGGVQALPAQQMPKLQLLQRTPQQQQLQVVQMPGGHKLQLVGNTPVLGKAVIQPHLQPQKTIIQQQSMPRVIQQAVTCSNTENISQEKLGERKETQPFADVASCKSTSIILANTEMPTTAVASQKPKLVHIGASGQKVIPLTPQVAAQLHIAMARKQAIDQAVKTVITSVTTSLPTACIKVSSPFEMPSRRPHRSVTITTPAMKAPIPAVRKGDEAELKPVSSSVAGSCHSSSEPAPTSHSFLSSTAQTTFGCASIMKNQMKVAETSLATTVQPVLSTVAATAASLAPKVLPNTTALSTSTAIKSPQKNVGLRLTAQSILTNKGVIQGVVVPAGVALSQLVLQQLKHVSDSQGLSVFQQSKDGTLQQIFFGNRHVSAEQLVAPQQLVRNVRPRSAQFSASITSSESGLVGQIVPKRLPAGQQQVVVSSTNAAVSKPVIMTQGQSSARILLPAVRPIQMVVQTQPSLSGPVSLSQMEKTIPSVVPSAVQLLKSVKGLNPPVQLQQVSGVSSGQAGIIQVTQPTASQPTAQTAVLAMSQPTTATQHIHLPAGSVQTLEGKAVPTADAVTQASGDDCMDVLKTPATQLSVVSSTQPSATFPAKHATAKEQPLLIQQQLLQLIQKQQVPVNPPLTVGEVKGPALGSSQAGPVANPVHVSTPKQPSKLVVFNVNGKLMTAQGVPVNLTQGLVKVGNQVIGAQASQRCQQTALEREHSDGSTVIKMAGGNQQVSALSSDTAASSSSISPVVGGMHLLVTAASHGSEQAGQGSGEMASGLQVLANAANLSANTKGE